MPIIVIINIHYYNVFSLKKHNHVKLHFSFNLFWPSFYN